MDISTPLSLPCGAVLKNRLAKAAMSDALADPRTNLPCERHNTVYARWAKGGVGLLITGNVMVDRMALEATRNVALEPTDAAKKNGTRNHLAAFAAWAQACELDGSVALVQLSHAGRQTARAVTSTPKSASARPLDIPGVPASYIGKPIAMTLDEVADVRDRFVAAAEYCQRAGFHGVQVHAAHGYLLCQFLSPLGNDRTDDYGGSPENRMRLLREVIAGVRAATGPGFVVSVKINSSDFKDGGATPEDALAVLQMLEAEGADLVEVSGGSYENPAMTGRGMPITGDSEAYFFEFAKQARKHVRIPIMLTGGFRSRRAMDAALALGACDVVGLARPLCLEPELPRALLSDPGARSREPKAGENGARLRSQWYTAQIGRMADGLNPDDKADPKAGRWGDLRNQVFEPATGWATRWIWWVLYWRLRQFLLGCQQVS